MIRTAWTLRWFFPITYFLAFLLPFVVVSLLWFNNLQHINELQKEQVEQRFYQSHKRMVEHEVDSIVARIDVIREEVRNESADRLKEHLGIAIRVIEEIYRSTGNLHRLNQVQQRAVDAIAPILSGDHFHSALILNREGDVLLRSLAEDVSDVFMPDADCLEMVVSAPDDIHSCQLRTTGGADTLFFLSYFKQLEIVVIVGVTEQHMVDVSQTRALEEIAAVRYGENGEGYLFAFEYSGTYLSHIAPKYIGMNLIDISDPNGVKINQEIVRVSRNGSGYVEYVWDRYKTGKLVDKVSYVRGYQDWEWAVGTGFYLDTLIETQSFQDDLVGEELRDSLLNMVLVTVALLLVTGIIAWQIIRGFNREIDHFGNFFTSNVKEAKEIDPAHLKFAEFRELAYSANKMLQARRIAEAQLQTVFNNIEDAIYVADPESYELLFVNEALRKQFGADIQGSICYQALQQRDSPCEFCTNRLIFGTNLGKSHVWEFHNEVSERWYGIVDRAIQWHDGRMVRFEHARDITDKKLAEIERENYQQRLETAVNQRTRELEKRTQELEVANKDLEGFSYSVSHDLRAPLRAIDGFISILNEEYTEALDAEGQRLFTIVQDNARKMGRLIDDILAFSRAGRLELDKQVIDMTSLAKSVWHELEKEIGCSNVNFICEDLPQVQADPNAIRQVLFNLLSNAVKFSVGREPIEIKVTGQIIDGFVRFTVQDNGIGFNNEYKDKLFVMFQRLHGMDEFEGTGVGLAIVKRFIQKHKGRVFAHGNPDGGAEFSFELPRVQLDEAQQEL